MSLFSCCASSVHSPNDLNIPGSIPSPNINVNANNKTNHNHNNNNSINPSNKQKVLIAPPNNCEDNNLIPPANPLSNNNDKSHVHDNNNNTHLNNNNDYRGSASNSVRSLIDHEADNNLNQDLDDEEQNLLKGNKYITIQPPLGSSQSQGGQGLTQPSSARTPNGNNVASLNDVQLDAQSSKNQNFLSTSPVNEASPIPDTNTQLLFNFSTNENNIGSNNANNGSNLKMPVLGRVPSPFRRGSMPVVLSDKYLSATNPNNNGNNNNNNASSLSSSARSSPKSLMRRLQLVDAEKEKALQKEQEEQARITKQVLAATYDKRRNSMSQAHKYQSPEAVPKQTGRKLNIPDDSVNTNNNSNGRPVTPSGNSEVHHNSNSPVPVNSVFFTPKPENETIRPSSANNLSANSNPNNMASPGPLPGQAARVSPSPSQLTLKRTVKPSDSTVFEPLSYYKAKTGNAGGHAYAPLANIIGTPELDHNNHTPNKSKAHDISRDDSQQPHKPIVDRARSIKNAATAHAKKNSQGASDLANMMSTNMKYRSLVHTTGSGASDPNNANNNNNNNAGPVGTGSMSSFRKDSPQNMTTKLLEFSSRRLREVYDGRVNYSKPRKANRGGSKRELIGNTPNKGNESKQKVKTTMNLPTSSSGANNALHFAAKAAAEALLKGSKASTASKEKSQDKKRDSLNATAESPSVSTRVRYVLPKGEVMLIDKRYELLSMIGSGASGVVCSAVDLFTGKRVAIKKIKSMLTHRILARRCMRELVIGRVCVHPHIMPLSHIMVPLNVESTRNIYTVCELMDADLNTVIKSDQVLSNYHVQYFFIQILKGLAYLHSGDIVHRDLTPRNILVNINCDVKISDFGMARLHCHTTDMDTFSNYITTRWYRAPEVLLGMPYSFAMDAWACGCILFELLCRRSLFPGQNSLHQMLLILKMSRPTNAFVNEYISQKNVRPSHPQSSTPHTVKEWINVLAPARLASNEAAAKYLEKSMAKLFPTGTDPRAIDLVTQLLCFDHNKRITIMGALRHPWLADLWQGEGSVPLMSLSDKAEIRRRMTDTENTENIKAVQTLIYQEISNHYTSIHQETTVNSVPVTPFMQPSRLDDENDKPNVDRVRSFNYIF